MDSRTKVSRKFQKFARLSNTFAQSVYEDGVPCIRATSQNRLHSRCITAIKISSGPNPFVVSAGLDCILLISDCETGAIIKQIDTNQSFVFSISILQNEGMHVIATASQDGNVRIYDCNMNFKCIRVIKQSSIGVCQILWTVVLFNDKYDTPYCLSAGATKTIHVVDWLTRVEVLTLDGHKEGVRCLDISIEGIIASGSNDRSVKLWDLYGKKFIQTLRGHKAEVNAVCFVPNTTFLITACESNLFRQWDYLTGNRLRCFNDYSGSTILTLSVLPHPDSPVIVVGGNVAEDSGSPLVSVELWALTTGKLLARCCGTRYQISGCHASFSEEGAECVVVAGGLDSTIRIWRVSADVFSSTALDDPTEDGDI